MKHELVKCVTMISGISGHLWPAVVPKDHLSFSEWPSPRVHIGSHEKERQNLCGRKTRYMQSHYVLAPIHIKLSFTKSEILSFTPCIDYSGGNWFKLGFVLFVSFFFLFNGGGGRRNQWSLMLLFQSRLSYDFTSCISYTKWLYCRLFSSCCYPNINTRTGLRKEAVQGRVESCPLSAFSPYSFHYTHSIASLTPWSLGDGFELALIWFLALTGY